MFCLLITALCWLTIAPVRAGGLPQGKSGFRCSGGRLRVKEFYVNWPSIAESSGKLPMSVTDNRMRGSYSMLMRSVQGSGSAAGWASAVLGASLAVAGLMEAAVEICSLALRTVSSLDAA